MAEIKDEYIQWPGPASFPSATTTPAYDRSADGNTTVHSHRGWEWVESQSPFEQAAAQLAQATIESAVTRMRTAFGQIYYQKGNADDEPDFKGESFGDTVRIQDPSTLDIVAEWKWNGIKWERMRVTSEQISNLDVGRLTAGSAAITEVVSRKIASDIGKFLQLTTDQLTVTGNASFVNATAKHIWAKIVSANDGEFAKITSGMIGANSITADKIRAGAIDGKVITGALFQTTREGNRGLKIGSWGLTAYDNKGNQTMNIDARSGSIRISGNLGRADSWSECYFDDLVWETTGTDVEHDGARIGVGLAFDSKIDNWKNGSIALKRDSKGEPSLMFQAPVKKSGNNYQPTITMGTKSIDMDIGGVKGRKNAGIWLDEASFMARCSWGVLRLTADAKGFFDRDDDVLVGTSGNGSWVRDPLQQAVALWAQNGQVGMQAGGKTHLWVDYQGVHIGGTKKFSMYVPKMSKARGGLMLEHSATESPYDGIEYWESITLGDSGTSRWVLPDYVPAIASKKAPWIVLTSSDARATLDRSGDLWHVDVTGTPGETVSVLVKGARMIDMDLDASGEPSMRDYARESPWALPPVESGSAHREGVGLGDLPYGPSADRKESDDNEPEQ